MKHDAVELLQNLRHVIQEAQEETMSPFRRMLDVPVCHRSYSSRERPAVKLSKTIPFMTGEDGTLQFGVLEYITEGVVPLIYYYYSSLLSRSTPIEQETEELELSVQIASALIVSIQSLRWMINYCSMICSRL